VVFVGCGGGNVVALATGSGEIKWSVRIGQKEDIQQVLECNGTIVARSYNALYGLAYDDGQLIWKTDVSPEAVIQSSGSVLVGATENSQMQIRQLWAIDTHTGEKAWSYPLRKAAQSYSVTGHFLYYVTYSIREDNLEPRLVQLKFDEVGADGLPVETGSTYIAKKNLDANDIVVHDDLLFGADGLEAFCFDLGLDRLIWTTTIPALAADSVYYVEGSLLLVYGGGELVAVNAKDGSIVWTYAGVTGIAICEGQI